MFKDDLFRGIGVYSRKDGSRYEGEFSRNFYIGYGAQWDKNGKLLKCGRWAKNSFLSRGAVPLRFLREKRFLSDHGQHPSQSLAASLPLCSFAPSLTV